MQLNHYNTKFKKQTFSLVLIADQVAYPANIGGLFRAADAFGVKKIILGGPRIQLNRKTWNTSRATENAVIYKQIEATSEVIKEYKSSGYQIIALEITENSKPMHKIKIDKRQPLVLIVGNERLGIDKSLLQLSDVICHIEMYGQNSSMNVVQATSIALYEITNRIKHA